MVITFSYFPSREWSLCSFLFWFWIAWTHIPALVRTNNILLVSHGSKSERGIERRTRRRRGRRRRRRRIAGVIVRMILYLLGNRITLEKRRRERKRNKKREKEGDMGKRERERKTVELLHARTHT